MHFGVGGIEACGTVCQPSVESRTLHSDNFVERSNAFIWSLTAAAPSNSVFSCAVYKFVYLLTCFRKRQQA